MQVKLRLTGAQFREFREHLFPGDGLEAVAVALCGRRAGSDVHSLMVHKLVPIPYEECTRTLDRVVWSTKRLVPLLTEAMRRDMAILRIHSHPGGYACFSSIDDESDADLFSSVFGWTDAEGPHASAIMLPDGRIFGRALFRDFRSPLSSVAVIGDDLRFWFATGEGDDDLPGFTRRHAQAFGAGTTKLLRRLTVGVVGCSGTGSVVIEQLARLGIGRLVLVDPDHVEDKNRNRILNAGAADAYLKAPKVHVAARAIARMGFGTEVSVFAQNLFSSEAVKAVAECDVVFGCVDGAEGRHLLGRLATYYCIPYFDVGVLLEADGKGGVDEIAGAVHYLKPGGSTLLERGAYTMGQVEAEGLRRMAPEEYRERVEAGYIRGVREDRPAVISVNMFFASRLVLEFLARLHSFRYDHNREFAAVYTSLAKNITLNSGEASGACNSAFSKYLGRGDALPLLDMPALSTSNAG
jgi:hypothetical protein